MSNTFTTTYPNTAHFVDAIGWIDYAGNISTTVQDTIQLTIPNP